MADIEAMGPVNSDGEIMNVPAGSIEIKGSAQLTMLHCWNEKQLPKEVSYSTEAPAQQ